MGRLTVYSVAIDLHSPFTIYTSDKGTSMWDRTTKYPVIRENVKNKKFYKVKEKKNFNDRNWNHIF